LIGDGLLSAERGGIIWLADVVMRTAIHHVVHTTLLHLPGLHTMIDETLAQVRAHHQNINRYRSLLQTNLTEFERRFIERRIAEEEAAVSALAFGDSQYAASKGSVEFDSSTPDAP
jgi:hypothetical protein